MELLRMIKDDIVHLCRRLSFDVEIKKLAESSPLFQKMFGIDTKSEASTNTNTNRPSELSEKFQDIYDNSYMDLCSYLIEDCKRPEKEAIKRILRTLQDIYKYYFHKNRTIGKENLEITEYQDEQACKDLRSVKFLLQNGGVHADTFITECREICKRMCISDSRVFLCFGFKHGGAFDTDVLTHYTSPGDKIDYLVWPAIYLHECGVILSKGVAKAKERRIIFKALKRG